MEEELEDGAPVAAYNTGLRAPVSACVSVGLPKAPVHRSEFAKVLAGEPVEINPSVGAGARGGSRGRIVEGAPEAACAGRVIGTWLRGSPSAFRHQASR